MIFELFANNLTRRNCFDLQLMFKIMLETALRYDDYLGWFIEYVRIFKYSCTFVLCNLP